MSRTFARMRSPCPFLNASSQVVLRYIMYIVNIEVLRNFASYILLSTIPFDQNWLINCNTYRYVVIEGAFGMLLSAGNFNKEIGLYFKLLPFKKYIYSSLEI